ncbi:SAM-dependent methyltransferase [Amycolatopsis orientalis]|uniref:SAM-dependent methyltransferase n=1 Tax=Amycolatopsis orientalis TaxID=31958 RepID=UPI0003F75CFC|nr:SAM-dependent methyltransferase [Amycolatopsis orientalis]
MPGPHDRRPFVPVDFDRPSIARVFDALMGGQDNYEADRVVLRQILELAPEAQVMTKEVRHWLVRTVRYLTDRAGIDQFLDLGSGFPTVDNTHQVAQRYNPEARVVYVDHDPVVLAHGRALLAANDFAHMAGNDLTEPATVIEELKRTHRLEFDRPIGLILCAIVHHIQDLDEAREIVRAYVGALAPGSFVVLLHQHNPADGSEAADLATSLEKRFNGTGLDTLYRTREEIKSFFGGLELVDPGLTYPHLWWPDGPRFTPLSPVNFTSLGGVARKP